MVIIGGQHAVSAQECDPYNSLEQTRKIRCPSGQTGAIIQQSRFICPEGYWQSWQELSNDCYSIDEFDAPLNRCVPNKKTRRSRCPSGAIGMIIQQSDFKCPAAQWGAWYNLVNKCRRCTPAKKTRNMRCPSGAIGTIIQQSDFKCPAARWSAWYNLVNKCRRCTPTQKTRNMRCPSGQNGTIVQQSRFTCPAAQWGGWVNISRNCR